MTGKEQDGFKDVTWKVRWRYFSEIMCPILKKIFQNHALKLTFIKTNTHCNS